MSEFAVARGLDLPDLARLVEADRARKVKAEQQEREHEESLSRGDTPSERQQVNWDAVFEGVDPLNSDALRSIYVSFSSYDIAETFFREALERVGVGQYAAFVRTVTNLPDFGVITLGQLVRSLSPVPNHLALRNAIHDAALSACRREPGLVVRSRWAAGLAPFESLMAQGLVQYHEVAKATAEGWTSRAEELNAARLFQVVDPLAAVLTPDEADRVLNYGLDLLEDVLKPDEGDGPWRVELEPPDSVVDALSGYIWAGLASPVAAERWEQAHVVRSAIELGWRELVEALLARAASGGGGVFVDQRFEFYAWHARQWLLIGLVRGGKENPAALQPAAPLLNAWAHEDHVVIRQLASQCLQLLGADGLEGVNQPKLSERVYSGFPAPVDDESSVNDDDDREHYFFPDIGPYWLEPLGRLFGLSQRAAERRTRRILNEHMRCPESDGEDARRRLKIFADRETWHSHGTLPSTDDSRAYNAYHAMMMVAATLLKERPPQRHEEETEAPFHAWLSQYVLMPESGWLADKRDPRLPPEPSWPRGYRDELWCSTVPDAYFDELLMTDDGMRVLWGRWSGRTFDHSERVSIRSALVSSCGAEALVAALQTAPDRFALPRAGEDADLHLGSLRMLAWVGDDENDSRPDSADPWATGIGHPGPSPADPIKLGLTLSKDGRVWTDGSGASLRCEHWAVVDGSGDDRDTLSGERLSGTRAFVQHLLRAHPGMTLIVSVHVRRDVRSSGEYRPPNARYFLIGDDGVAHSLSSRT